MTFEPHPRNVFKPDTAPFRLTPLRVKAREIAALGVDHLVVLRFNRAFSQMPAEAFVHDVIVKGLGAHHVVCGYDFAFGHGRTGTPEFLLHMGKSEGFGFTCVPQMKDGEGEGFSSTRARECLVNGDPSGATHVLGRPFEIEGRVVVGDRRGRTIGYPTVNLRLGDFLRPATGVYATRIGIEDNGKTIWHDGVANLGYKPTFAGADIGLEAHIFDFEADLYGRRVRVALVDHLRPEQKFDGLEQLKKQIAEDSERARRILARP
jgi:riboflavin kinase/FMN adenylyltransferase